MFGSVMMAALALVIVEPQIKFTSDSVYTKESIIQVTPIEREDTEETGLVDLQFTFDKLLGYEVYDDPKTDYIDGLKVNDAWVSKSLYFEKFNPTVENTITIKTVYSDDYAGMVMAAKDGDWSLMLKNPENILKLVYYAIAIISILFGGFSLFRNKKFKSKTVADVENGVMSKISDFDIEINKKLVNMVDEIFVPTIKQAEEKYDNIIKSILLSRSGTTEDTLALIDLLKQATTKEDVERLAESLKKSITSEAKAKATAVAEAKQIVQKFAEDVKTEVKKYDGTSI